MLRRAKSKPLTRLPVVLDSMESRALADDADVCSMAETRLSSTVGDLLHFAARVPSSMMQVGRSCRVPLDSFSTVVKVPGPNRRDGGVTAEYPYFSTMRLSWSSVSDVLVAQYHIPRPRNGSRRNAPSIAMRALGFCV